MIVPGYMNSPELATILEINAAGTVSVSVYLTETRKVHTRKLLSAYAHGYPVPPQALVYIRQHHKAFLTDEALAQLKAADPYVPGSATTREDGDESRISADTGTQTAGALSFLQQSIAEMLKFDLDEICRTGHPQVKVHTRKLTEDSDILEEYPQDEEFMKALESMFKTIGAPCYDNEGLLAIGSLRKAEYFLMPDTIQFEPCAVDNICRGFAFWKPDVELVAQVYTLAKAQALQLGISGHRQIKWAVLRTQAFSAGWYHGQKYSRFCSPPKNSPDIYAADTVAIEKYLSDAWKLACFLPFLHEFAFRTTGSMWGSYNAPKYEGRARKFAVSASVGHCLSYLTGKDLYGPALQWIGVEMPMKVLQRKVRRYAIPAVFAIRTKAAPAGKVLITTTQAVLKQMMTLDCWNPYRRCMISNYTIVSEAAGKIQANPWRYHESTEPYNLEPLSEEERLEVAAAGKCAEDYAKVTFAFTQTVMKGSYPLPGYHALKRHARVNGLIYRHHKKLLLLSRRI